MNVPLLILLGNAICAILNIGNFVCRGNKFSLGLGIGNLLAAFWMAALLLWRV